MADSQSPPSGIAWETGLHCLSAAMFAGRNSPLGNFHASRENYSLTDSTRQPAKSIHCPAKKSFAWQRFEINHFLLQKAGRWRFRPKD
jgi:hypothetical protein